MKKNRITALLLAVAMIATLITGCGGKTDNTPPPSSSGTSTQQTPEKTPDPQPEAKRTSMVVGVAADASTMDPQKQGKMADMNILINIYDTLVTRDESGQLAPSLATEWKTVDDVTWQFKLREGVKFHNGEDFNAEAAKFSLDRLLDPDTASPIAELRAVTGVEIVDDYTINVITEAPDPIIPNKMVLFGGVMLPPKYTAENDADFLAQNPVGTGPYKFVSWQKDSSVVLEANEEYWRGAPAIKDLTFRIIPNAADTLAALKTGEVNFVQGLSGDLAASLEGTEGVKMMSADWIKTYFISIDTAVEPLNIKEVRQALNYAVDKEAIIGSILGGNAQQVATILPRQNFGYDAAIDPYPYDPEKAKELLAGAGYPDGFEVTFDALTTESTTIQAIVGYLEAVGVKVNMNMVDSSTLVSNCAAKTAAPLYMNSNSGWTMDGMSNFQSFAKRDRRYARGGTQELDDLVDVEETTVDPAIRQEAFTRAQEILKEEALFIYLWQANNVLAMSDDINFTPNMNGTLWMYGANPA